MILEEKLKEKSFQTGERLGDHVVTIPDALEILKDCYTKEEMEKLLEKAIKLIRAWHGLGMKELEEQIAWDIYYNQSPEMKPFREFLNAPQPKLKGDE